MAVNEIFQRYNDVQIKIKKHLYGFTPLEKKQLDSRSSLTGFSLLELMVVVIIIAILAALVMPKYDKTVENSRIAEAKHVLGMMRDALIRYAEQNDLYPATTTQLDINVTPGKFFTFTLCPYGGCSYTNTNNEVIARATRNGIKVGGGYHQNYYMEIYENGAFAAGAPGGGGGEPPPQYNESS